jgi:hypothetical protein
VHYKRLLLLLTASLALAATAPAQNRRGLPANAALLKRKADEWRREGNREREKAYRWARKKGWVLRQVLPGGGILALQRLDENGHPVYYATDFNTRAAATTRTDQLWAGGALGLSLSGNSPSVTGKLALWDGGPVRATHRELAGRVVQADAGAVVDPGTGTNHATHVAGTLTATGVQSYARGMAFGFSGLQAYDFNDDMAEMAAAAPNLLVSNHSYSTLAGWRINGGRAGTATDPQWEWLGDASISTTEDARFGFYNTEARRWDEITHNAPYYLPVKSAGNFRSQNGPVAGQPYWQRNGNGTYDLVAARPEGMSSNNGYDIITTYATAKNILTVGAVEAVAGGYNQPADVRIASFSSWGPTDDGRIKPDLVANGVAVFSAGGASDSAYATLNGTSMASPNVAGTLVLLQEYYAGLHNGVFMRAATLKGLAIHTADEAGTAPGPDYQYGWGLLNAGRAAQVIAGNGQDHILTERTLAQADAYTLPVVASGRGPLVVTLSWSDPPGPVLVASTANLNNRSPRLVNDLDVRVVDATGTYLPWTLNPDVPQSPATAGDNTRDNVEQVVVAHPVPGRAYSIRVTHKGSLQGERQAYALLVSGTGGGSFCASAGLARSGSRIGRVTLGTLSNGSGTGCAAYADYAHLSANVAPGQSLPLAVTLANCGGVPGGFVQVFVDWNGDFRFSGPGERAAASGAIAGTGTFNTRITVPAAMVPGTVLRMRVVTSRAAGVAPCGDYAEGETEDYTLRVVRPQLDVQPVALAFPGTDPCPHPALPVVVTLRNIGAGPLADVPVQVVVKGESTPPQTLTGVLPGELAPFAEGKVALDGTFAARAGERYTFTLTTRAPGDANRANDTLSFRRTVGQPGGAPIATATACAADSVQLQSGGPGVTYWYDAPAGGNLLGVGNRISTAVRTPNLAYYAATNEFVGKLGPARKNFASEGGYDQFSPAVRLTTQVPLVIERARLYVGNGGTVTFTIETPSGVPVSSQTIDVTPTRRLAGAGTLPDDPVDTGRVYLLQLSIPRPGNYQISVSYGNGATLFRNNSGVAGYPFTIPGVAAITGNTAPASENFYYYLYDVEVKAYGCPGPRVAVAANWIEAPAPTAVLRGGDAVCEGDTAQLMVQLGGTPPWNLTYTDGTRSTEVTGITESPFRMKVTRAGTYAITALTDAKSCPVYRATGPVAVTLRPAPTATIRLEDRTLMANEGAGYAWFLNGVPMPDSNMQQLEVWQDGRYRVAVTYQNGCTSLSEEVPVILAAIPDADEPRVKLWPNPTDGLFYLKGTPLLPAIRQVRLVNLLGQTVATWQDANPVQRRRTSLDISSLGKGTYLLVVEAESRTYVLKVFKH